MPFLAVRRRSIAASALVGAVALLTWVPTSAYLTVGPHGTYSTIQDGIAAANGHGGDEIRVEVKLCNDIHGFQYVCPYVENVYLQSSNHIEVIGGWSADFQTRSPNLYSQLKGVANAGTPTFDIAATAGNVALSRIYIDGTGITPAAGTYGLFVDADSNSLVTITDVVIHGAQDTSIVGGGGLSALAQGSSEIDFEGSTIENSELFGSDGNAANGAGAYLHAIQGKIKFIGNLVQNNTLSNSSGGGCHGGGVSVDNTLGEVTLQGNTYLGNAQLFCTNGATGDGADIYTYGGTTYVYDETWTANRIDNDPGVYEVFVQSIGSSTTYMANGLITHGTWGGLFLSAEAGSTIALSNYTVADNPAVGVTAYGAGTQIWNSIFWNDGGDLDLHGANLQYSLSATDPMFVDAAGGNYRLTWGSTAINTGSNSPPGGLRSTDLDGHPRPFAHIADMGAYEFSDRVFGNGFEPPL